MAKIERQKRIYRKRIPYGMQNFEDVMERDCIIRKTKCFRPAKRNVQKAKRNVFVLAPSQTI